LPLNRHFTPMIPPYQYVFDSRTGRFRNNVEASQSPN
jgi:hypothetical protein